MVVLGVDVGGSGIKGALVDLEKGELTTERFRLLTPEGFEPEAVAQTVTEVVREFDYDGPVGLGFPAAVAEGTVLSAPTAHAFPGWRGICLNELFSAATGTRVYSANDADVAGLAEVRFGAGRGVSGVVITVTLGTGVGAGLFMDGRLVPNLEIGKIHLAGHEAVVELYVASRIRKEENLKWAEYGRRLGEFCDHLDAIFSPSRIIIGGGVSNKHKKFLADNPLRRAEVVPAALRNEAGIVGAAAWAAGNATRPA